MGEAFCVCLETDMALREWIARRSKKRHPDRLPLTQYQERYRRRQDGKPGVAEGHQW
jgi:ribosomal protein L33